MSMSESNTVSRLAVSIIATVSNSSFSSKFGVKKWSYNALLNEFDSISVHVLCSQSQKTKVFNSFFLTITSAFKEYWGQA